MKGTLLNAGAVALGAGIGIEVGKYLPAGCDLVAMDGLGLVVSLIGVRMFLQTKNAVVIVAAIALGGILGVSLGISNALNHFAEVIRGSLGGGGKFDEALITTTVLFCVGPMTILGCLQDGLEGNYELLATKSILDGISSVFFAATLGAGVFVTAVIVLVAQGSLTLLARPFRRLMEHEAAIQEASAAGGAMMVGIGLSLLKIKSIHVENYLPALILAPVFFLLNRRFIEKPKAAV